MAEEWDAREYDRVADPQTAWGLAVLERLQLAGHERVLDAGCGTGRVTAALLDRLPRGRVIALDGSRRMLEVARGRLDPDRTDLLCADLAGTLPLADGSLDAAFSTATFHWIPDHDRLLSELGRTLRPGGTLVAQCGGAGNIDAVLAAQRALRPEWDERVTFATPAETEARLRASGFGEARAWLEPAPARFDSPEALVRFLRTVCLRRFLAGVPEPERDELTRAVAKWLPGSTVDYVRLNIVARRG